MEGGKNERKSRNDSQLDVTGMAFRTAIQTNKTLESFSFSRQSEPTFLPVDAAAGGEALA